MAKVKIAVLANCQARPIARMLDLMGEDVEVVATTITHLAKAEECDDAYAAYRGADYIFAQAVNDQYPVKFVTTSALKQNFGAKVISWPNAFFKGQGPDICYLSMPSGGRVLGPLTEYQSYPVYQFWKAGLGATEAVTALRNDPSWIKSLTVTPEQSIRQLRNREAALDVGLADEIEARWKTERLFFTFNHPSKDLLAGTVRRLLKHVGIGARETPALQRMPEPLDKVIPALLPVVADALGLRIPTSESTKGCVVEIGSGVAFTKEARHYELPELVEVSYRCLDKQITPSTEVRVT